MRRHFLKLLSFLNFLISIIFVVCYSYQLFYIPVVWAFKNKHEKKIKENRGEITLHKFAAIICARNEEKVIGDLINSLKSQTYPQEYLTIVVMADNCTDKTAEIAESLGAVVYTRFNDTLVGKGYALDELFRDHLTVDYKDAFDGYFIFDADNILAADYIERMNEKFCDGSDVITSYRNSKNFDSGWVAAGCGLWFLRESRYLNNARAILGVSGAVSGTGYLFSQKVLDTYEGRWPFHLLTEDIEFSIDWISKGHKIDICTDAVFYDEQAVKLSQSFRQRARWSRGYIQVLRKYFFVLMKGIFTFNFSCFDFFMNIAPAYILSLASIISNISLSIIGLCYGDNPLIAVGSIAQLLLNSYLIAFLVGIITVITEWKMIRASSFKKIMAAFTFPIFMLTFIPVAVAALFVKVKWKPIEHEESIDERKKKGKETDY
ncbi:MAG: glycosyltransferase [Clostridia bacterium]|nr:glycosyltransferase [Clostridia bacterium]